MTEKFYDAKEAKFNGICHYLPYKKTAFSWFVVPCAFSISAKKGEALTFTIDYYSKFQEYMHTLYQGKPGIYNAVKEFGKYAAMVKISGNLSSGGSLWIKTNCASAYYNAKKNLSTPTLPLSLFCGQEIEFDITGGSSLCTFTITKFELYAPSVIIDKSGALVSPYTNFSLKEEEYCAIVSGSIKTEYVFETGPTLASAVIHHEYIDSGGTYFQYSNPNDTCASSSSITESETDYYGDPGTLTTTITLFGESTAVGKVNTYDIQPAYGPFENFTHGTGAGTNIPLTIRAGSLMEDIDFADKHNFNLYVTCPNLIYLEEGLINLFKVKTVEGEQTWKCYLEYEQENTIPYLYSYNSMFMRDFLFYTDILGDLRSTELPTPPSEITATFSRHDGTLEEIENINVVYLPITKMSRMWNRGTAGQADGGYGGRVAGTRYWDYLNVFFNDTTIINKYFVPHEAWNDYGNGTSSVVLNSYWRNPFFNSYYDARGFIFYEYANPFFISNVMPFSPISSPYNLPDPEYIDFDREFKFCSLIAHCVVPTPRTFNITKVYLKKGNKETVIPSSVWFYNRRTGLLNIPLVYANLYKIENDGTGNNSFKVSGVGGYKLVVDYSVLGKEYVPRANFGGIDFNAHKYGKLNVNFKNISDEEYLWFYPKKIDRYEARGNVDGFLLWNSDNTFDVNYYDSDIYRDILWLRNYILNIMFYRIPMITTFLPLYYYELTDTHRLGYGDVSPYGSGYIRPDNNLYIYKAPENNGITSYNVKTTADKSDGEWTTKSETMYSFFNSHEEVIALYVYDSLEDWMKSARENFYFSHSGSVPIHGGVHNIIKRNPGGSSDQKGHCGLHCLYAFYLGKEGDDGAVYCRRSVLATDNKPTNIEINEMPCLNPNFISPELCYTLDYSRNSPEYKDTVPKPIRTTFTMSKVKAFNDYNIERNVKFLYIKLEGKFNELTLNATNVYRHYEKVDTSVSGTLTINFITRFPETFTLTVDGPVDLNIIEVGGVTVDPPPAYKFEDQNISYNATPGHSDYYDTDDIRQYCMPIFSYLVKDLYNFINKMKEGAKSWAAYTEVGHKGDTYGQAWVNFSATEETAES